MSAERIIAVNVAASKPPAPPWEIVEAGGNGLGRRHTVYHRRKLSRGQWLAVKRLDDGTWLWRRYNDHGRRRGLQAEGIEPTWQAARRAADDETRATWYAQGCPEVLT